jgi:hypothetical protein
MIPRHFDMLYIVHDCEFLTLRELRFCQQAGMQSHTHIRYRWLHHPTLHSRLRHLMGLIRLLVTLYFCVFLQFGVPSKLVFAFSLTWEALS